MDITYEFHDLSLRFPQMADAELAALAADMATPGNGMIDPITLHQGKILDGRSRYQAWQLPVCQKAGVELKTTPYTGDSPLAFVVSKNVPRRHLSSSQAAALAVELLPELEEEFKAHQRLGRAELPDPDRSGKAVDFAARLTGTCGRQVQDAKKVKSSVPELIEFIRAGELSVGGAKSLATAITKLPAKKKEKVMGLFGKGVKAIREALKTAKPAVPSIVRSLTALEKKDDDSVEIFLTNEGTYSRIAEAARAKLTPDGVCLVYCDQGSIPAAAAEIQKQLPYWCAFAACDRKKWKPVLAFCKTLRDVPAWAADLVSEDELLRRLVKPAAPASLTLAPLPAIKVGKKSRNVNQGTRDWASHTANIILGCTGDCDYCFAQASANKRNCKIAKAGGTDFIVWSVPKFIGYDQVDQWHDTDVMFPSSHDIEMPFINECTEAIRRLLANNNHTLVVSKPRFDCIKHLCGVFKPTDNMLFRFTITSSNEDLAKRHESGAPSYAERFDCLKYACERGFATSVSCEPMLDTVNIVAHFHQLEPFVTNKIWLGPMSATGNPEACACRHEAELEEIRAQQTPEKLLEVYLALRDEPKAAFKSHYENNMKKMLGTA